MSVDDLRVYRFRGEQAGQNTLALTAIANDETGFVITYLRANGLKGGTVWPTGTQQGDYWRCDGSVAYGFSRDSWMETVMEGNDCQWLQLTNAEYENLKNIIISYSAGTTFPYHELY